MYECSKCRWKGDEEAVATVQTHEFMGVDETEVAEADNEFVKVCPKCKPYRLVYSNEY